MPSRYLSKGQKIRIELPGSSEGSKSRGTISASVSRVLFSSFLAKISKGEKVIPGFTLDSPVNLYIGWNDRLYTGVSKVVDLELGAFPWMQLAIPDKVKRVEMRRWVRVAASLNVQYRLANYNWPYYEASTLDISAGGLLFTAPHVVDEKLSLELGINLPNQHKLDSVVEVKRCESYNTRWGDRYRIGCSFKSIGDRERETLVRFVFSKQRELLKQGRLY